MKRTILSLLAFMVVMVAWADDITAQQALQQAQSFIKQRETAGSRPKRIKGSPMKLTMVKQVSGLYLFNINDNGGFVIVSNDDRTRPILGFSDSGAIDPDNMPSNMRAWLQGYADEIAWAKAHSAKTPVARTKAPRRVGSHSTTAIAPLVKTTWNQGAPYNNMTPYYKWNGSSYAYNTTGGSGYQHCVTGCVATAMAQVMKYHQWPQDATEPIPNYCWNNLTWYINDGNDYGPGALSATTFDWSNMLNSYSSSATGTTANAVATLMKYCGYSVEMNYGPSSGSNTDKVADALKTYFDYDETTQLVIRSFYTYANWTDLIYHELANHRPVVYGGSSSGGGHEFVCDGYKYESSTDFFHINWGWGGMSDNYFVLSALDPDQQGIGGSSSNDGYHYGQDAVIGIQKKNGGGTIADIQQSTINLKLNSMKLSNNPVLVNTELSITLNITNQGENDYDGDIYVGWDYGLEGNNCYIPAGETRDVVVSMVPNALGTFALLFYIPNKMGSFSTDGAVAAKMDVVSSFSGYVPNFVAAKDMTGSTATITWIGASENYNVRHRAAAGYAALFEDSFESGLGNWTIYTKGEAPLSNGWVWGSGGHSGNYAALAFSWRSNVAYDADNWLISPQVTLGDKLKFWVRTDPGYPDIFEVRFSPSDKTIDNFTIQLQNFAEAPHESDWNEVTIDLSKYKGQVGYIAIHHKCKDCNYLYVDDFGIYNEGTPAGEWQTTTANQTSVVLKGLTEATTYEAQVQSETSDWSDIVSFTTNNTILGDANSDNKVTITDAVGVVNAIHGNPSGDFNAAAANINGDVDEFGTPQISITDAVGVVNIILNSGGSAPALDAPAVFPE